MIRCMHASEKKERNIYISERNSLEKLIEKHTCRRTGHEKRCRGVCLMSSSLPPLLYVHQDPRPVLCLTEVFKSQYLGYLLYKDTMELTLQKVYLARTCMPVLPIVNSYILFSSSVIISVRPPI
jgi:hypothetical protein